MVDGGGAATTAGASVVAAPADDAVAVSSAAKDGVVNPCHRNDAAAICIYHISKWIALYMRKVSPCCTLCQHGTIHGFNKATQAR